MFTKPTPSEDIIPFLKLKIGYKNRIQKSDTKIGYNIDTFDALARRKSMPTRLPTARKRNHRDRYTAKT